MQIFLDVQKAYEVLSDETKRQQYDAGDTKVGDGPQNMKPMRFRVVSQDKKRGKAKVWWYDPNTGEEGFMEMDIDTEEEEEKKRAERQKDIHRPLFDHCCLPAPGDEFEQSDAQ